MRFWTWRRAANTSTARDARQIAARPINITFRPGGYTVSAGSS